MNKVIAISGKAGNGKDLLGDILGNELNGKVLKLAFGDYLKYLLKKIYNWNGIKDEYGRSLLQSVGDKIKESDSNFFVKIINDTINIFGNEYDYIIVTDCRYKNEIYGLCGNNLVTTVRVSYIKESTENDIMFNEEQRNHSSEKDLDDFKFDIYIKSSNENELKEQVDNIIKIMNKKELKFKMKSRENIKIYNVFGIYKRCNRIDNNKILKINCRNIERKEYDISIIDNSKEYTIKEFLKDNEIESILGMTISTDTLINFSFEKIYEIINKIYMEV